jgi:hypothetical protein
MMFQTYISADLPSEETPGAAEADAHGQTHDRVTFSATRLLTTLQRLFEQAGITDVTYAVIDDQVVYRDNAESDYEDLDQLLTAATDEGFSQRPFNLLAMGLSCWQQGVQHIVEARVAMQVPVGQHELEIRVSSRPDDCNARRLDDAERYARRISEFAADLERISRWRDKAQSVADSIVDALRVTLFRRSIHAPRTRMEIMRPTNEHLNSMEHVVFGDRIKPPQYSLQPPMGRREDQAWPDPAIHVYDDPFLTFRHWAFLTAMMSGGALRVEWVAVVDERGKTLFAGHKARWFENWPWAKKFDVEFLPEAGVRVNFSLG